MLGRVVCGVFVWYSIRTAAMLPSIITMPCSPSREKVWGVTFHGYYLGNGKIARKWKNYSGIGKSLGNRKIALKLPWKMEKKSMGNHLGN